MNRTNVSSSMISSIGYDAAEKILEIEFKRGALYQYASVPEGVFIAILKAPSAGKYFDANIREKFRTTKIDLK